MMNAREQRACLSIFRANLDCSLELFAVVVAEFEGEGYGLTHCDVDFSKSYGYVYHMSGAWGAMPVAVDGIYHISGPLTVKEEPSRLCLVEDGEITPATKYLRAVNRTRRLSALPRQFRGKRDILDWLGSNAVEDDTVYCSACHDHLPSEHLCAHCWWCSSVGWYVTPDEGAACFDPDCYECQQMRRDRHEAYWRNRRLESRRWMTCGSPTLGQLRSWQQPSPDRRANGF